MFNGFFHEEKSIEVFSVEICQNIYHGQFSMNKTVDIFIRKVSRGRNIDIYTSQILNAQICR